MASTDEEGLCGVGVEMCEFPTPNEAGRSGTVTTGIKGGIQTTGEESSSAGVDEGEGIGEKAAAATGIMTTFRIEQSYV